jgi:type I restriction enzyme R subunit
VDSDELLRVEQPAIDQLKSLGWICADGRTLVPESSDERNSLKSPILERRLTQSIKRINPWISDENLQKILRELTKTQFAGLLEANQFFWEQLTQYISVQQDLGQGNRGQTVKIIDFENIHNNEFLCVNQFKVSGPNQNIIPDIVLFINGLPIAVIECKSPYITNPMEEGLGQLMRYANRRNPQHDEGAERLFHFNQLMVSTYRDGARVGTITSRMDHFLEWKDPHPVSKDTLGSDVTSQEVLIAGLFTKKNILDLIRNFTVFEVDEGKTIKKIARYQQYRAVHKTIERLKSGHTAKDRGGVIWHTQGSGKSLTMVFLAIKLRREESLRDYKLVFLTDRTQLDKQLTDTFGRTQNETVHRADSVRTLRELLQRDSSDLITSTIQKFQENSEDPSSSILNTSEKIIVLADEAHRTQYGTLGSALNTALPNAVKIAFTGTPLLRTERTTQEFGSYIDKYTIEQAVKDGSTVQLLYEGREVQLKVTGDSLDSLFDEYFSEKSDEEKTAIRLKYGTQNAILEAPQRIRRVCIDIIKHYKEHIYPNGFKAMIVTSSRSAAVTYKKMMDELGGFESSVVISGSHNDEPRFHPWTDATKHKSDIENFKKPFGTDKDSSNLAFLIVKDMLLTGFDAPIAQVMYLDRKLTDHTLLQAIARVNRTYKGKSRGFIVDYYGLSDYLTEALEMFTQEDVVGAFRKLEDEIPHLQHAHTRVMKHFTGMDLTEIDDCVLTLRPEQKRQDFFTDFQLFSKQMDIVLPDPSANPYLKDLKLLGKITNSARNMYRDDQLNIAGAGEKVRKLIEEHIRSTGVDPKIPPIDLLAPDFKEKLNQHKSSRAKASEIESAIRHHIKIKIEENPEYYRSLSEKLEELIRKHEEKWDELVQLLLNFRDTIESNKEDRAKSLGLTETEFAFHEILMAEVTKQLGDVIDEETHRKVIGVVQELTKMMDEATAIVGFFSKWDEQKRVGKEIKRAILSQSFGTEELAKIISSRFMELAQVKFK